MSRVFLTLMTSAGNEENLKEIIEPIKSYLDGVIVVFHNPVGDDAGAKYLESVKGAGKIIYRDWIFRHDISQSETLWTGVLEEGDYGIICDTLERPAIEFVSEIKTFWQPQMEINDTDCIYYFGKAYLFKYNENMYYSGSPHWALRGVMNGVEVCRGFPDESKMRLNVRPIKRTDPFGFIDHYLKYYLYPAGSNHCLLGLEKNGDPKILFPQREHQRLEFRKELKKRGIPLTVEGVKELFKNPLDETMRKFVNGELILNNFYQYHVLDNKNITDNHDFKSIIKI